MATMVESTAEPAASTASVDARRDRRRLCLPRLRQPELAVAGAVAGAIALLDVPSGLGAVCLALFILVGPGAAVLTWVSIPRRALPATVPVLGMAITTLVTIIAMWSYRWHPEAILWVQVVAVVGSSAYWYYRNGTSILQAPTPWRTYPVPRRAGKPLLRQHLSILLTGIALVLWLVAVPGLDGVDASYYGLLFSGSGPLLAVCIVLCASAMLVAVRDRLVLPAAAAVGAAIVVSRVTTVVATEVPLYDWTYKHLAVVDYIMVHGQIAPDGTDIYTQWAAFFVEFAWFAEVTGIAPITIAHVFAPVVHVLLAVTVYSAARVLGRSRRTALVAAFVAEIANWVGQDYFCPQAWTLVLAFGMLVLVLASPQNRACGFLAILVYAATVPSHQLTPFWLLAVVTLLCVLKRARPRWIALAMAAIALGYLLLNLEAVLPYGLISGGSPVSNAESNVQTSGVPARDHTSTVVRSMSAFVVLTAMVSMLGQWRRKRPVLAVGIVAFSSFGLLFGQSYGGEAIFRVFLYALLGMAILLAPAIVSAMDGGGGWLRTTAVRTATVIGVSAVAVAGLHGYVALWPLVYQTRAQLDVMQSLTTGVDLNTRFIMLRAGGLPTRVNADYAEITLFNSYYDHPISYDLWDGRDPRLLELKARFPTEDDLRSLDEVAQGTYRTYVMFSTQSNRAVRYYGDFRPEAADLVQDALRAAPNWTIVHEGPDTVIFQSINPEESMGRHAPGHVEVAPRDGG